MPRDVTAGDHYCVKFCIMRRIVRGLWARKNQFVAGWNFKHRKYFYMETAWPFTTL